MVFPQHAVLPQGSLIFVTGVTGLIGSIIADQLLLHGYRTSILSGRCEATYILLTTASRCTRHRSKSGIQQGIMGECWSWICDERND